MSKYYETDTKDPEAPVELEEYRGIKVGSKVRYENPYWRRADGTYQTGGVNPPLIVSAIYKFENDHVQAILNNGRWELNAKNLVLDTK